jgi:hypothetical protein
MSEDGQKKKAEGSSQDGNQIAVQAEALRIATSLRSAVLSAA